MQNMICFNKRTNKEEIIPFSSPKLHAKCRVVIGSVSCKTDDKFYYVKRNGEWTGHWIGNIHNEDIGYDPNDYIKKEKKFYPNQINQAIAYLRSIQKSDKSGFRLVCWENGVLGYRIHDIREWQGLNYKILNFSLRNIPYLKSVEYFTVEMIKV